MFSIGTGKHASKRTQKYDGEWFMLVITQNKYVCRLLCAICLEKSPFLLISNEKELVHVDL